MDIHLSFDHIPGKDNDVADALSRAHLGARMHGLARGWMQYYSLVPVLPCLFFLSSHSLVSTSRPRPEGPNGQGGRKARDSTRPGHQGKPRVIGEGVHRLHVAGGCRSIGTPLTDDLRISGVRGRAYTSPSDHPQQALARAHVLAHGGRCNHSNAYNRDKSYQSRAKDALPMPDMARALGELPNSMVGDATRAAVLTMFYAALRQSEVAPPTMGAFDHTRHPTRGEIRLTTEGISLRVKWAKNMQKVGQQRTVTLPLVPEVALCPVRAIRANIMAVPTKSQKDPLLMLPSRAPVPCSLVKKTWDTALHVVGVDITTYSLHSLRKAAATQAHAKGCTETEIQRHGGWRSTAYRTYIATRTGRVTSALVDSIAN